MWKFGWPSFAFASSQGAREWVKLPKLRIIIIIIVVILIIVIIIAKVPRPSDSSSEVSSEKNGLARSRAAPKDLHRATNSTKRKHGKGREKTNDHGLSFWSPLRRQGVHPLRVRLRQGFHLSHALTDQDLLRHLRFLGLAA